MEPFTQEAVQALLCLKPKIEEKWNYKKREQKISESFLKRGYRIEMSIDSSLEVTQIIRKREVMLT